MQNASARILKPWKRDSGVSHIANRKTVKHSLLNKVLELRSHSDSGQDLAKFLSNTFAFIMKYSILLLVLCGSVIF
jgi:hypothetical protein